MSKFVLVHGAWQGGYVYARVARILREAGHDVYTPTLTGLGERSHLANHAINLDTHIRDIVNVFKYEDITDAILCGHSYGGMIITNAVPQTTNVVGLVYVAAFAPDKGETLAGIVGRSTDSVLTTAVLESQFPTGHNGDTAAELIIDPTKFRQVFTADLPQLESDVYGLSQRPIAAGALVEETMHVAWKDLPTWAAVGTGDKAAGADVVRSMAQRAGATITEIDGSHVIMISQPDAVTEVILTALTAVTPHAG